jgi:hypothetical protein
LLRAFYFRLVSELNSLLTERHGPRQYEIRCTVCQTGVVDTELIPCGHFFHGECMMRWLQTSDSCPICQQNISKFVLADQFARAKRSQIESNNMPPNPATATEELQKRKKHGGLRRGKWTQEEEAYTKRLISEFKRGVLPLSDGTTLRTFLSRLLNCDPMRISKKFVGVSCIGKQVFRRAQTEIDKLTQDDIERTRTELAELEQRFLTRLNKSKRSSEDGMGGPMQPSEKRQRQQHSSALNMVWQQPSLLHSTTPLHGLPMPPMPPVFPPGMAPPVGYPPPPRPGFPPGGMPSVPGYPHGAPGSVPVPGGARSPYPASGMPAMPPSGGINGHASAAAAAMAASIGGSRGPPGAPPPAMGTNGQYQQHHHHNHNYQQAPPPSPLQQSPSQSQPQQQQAAAQQPASGAGFPRPAGAAPSPGNGNGMPAAPAPAGSPARAGGMPRISSLDNMAMLAAVDGNLSSIGNGRSGLSRNSSFTDLAAMAAGDFGENSGPRRAGAGAPSPAAKDAAAQKQVPAPKMRMRMRMRRTVEA